MPHPNGLSTAPATVTKVVQARLAGKSKRQISKDFGMSQNTVRKVLAQSNIDQLIRDQRVAAFQVAPDAVQAIHKAINKNDNRAPDHAFRLLEGLGILGNDDHGLAPGNTVNIAIGSLLPKGEAKPEPPVIEALPPVPVDATPDAQPDPSSREAGGGSISISNTTQNFSSVEGQVVDNKEDTP